MLLVVPDKVVLTEHLCLRKGAVPEIIVQHPDRTHAALALSATDNPDPPPIQNPTEPVALLDLQGLRNLVRLVEGLRARQRATETSAPLTQRGAHSHDAIG